MIKCSDEKILELLKGMEQFIFLVFKLSDQKTLNYRINHLISKKSI